MDQKKCTRHLSGPFDCRRIGSGLFCIRARSTTETNDETDVLGAFVVPFDSRPNFNHNNSNISTRNGRTQNENTAKRNAQPLNTELTHEMSNSIREKFVRPRSPFFSHTLHRVARVARVNIFIYFPSSSFASAQCIMGSPCDGLCVTTTFYGHIDFGSLTLAAVVVAASSLCLTVPIEPTSPHVSVCASRQQQLYKSAVVDVMQYG